MMQDAVQRARQPVVGALRRFMEDERGTAMAEYALVTAILAMAMIGTLHLIATETGTNLTRTGNSLTNQSYTP